MIVYYYLCRLLTAICTLVWIWWSSHSNIAAIGAHIDNKTQMTQVILT